MNAHHARFLLLLLSFTLASAPVLVLAQRRRTPPVAETAPPPAPPVPTAEEVRDEQARALFEEGRTAFSEARFADALEFFRRAHALSHRHALLYNIGQAADRLRLDREALEAFDLYLAEVPDAANRVEVETRVAVLRETIAREDALRAEAGRPSLTPRDEPVETQWWFWTLIGLGVAGAGVGVAAGLGAFNSTELAAPTPGDVGPGGVVVALEVRP